MQLHIKLSANALDHAVAYLSALTCIVVMNVSKLLVD